MALKSTNAESYAFAPSVLLSLYEIDSRYVSVNGSILRFHAGVNGLYTPVVFNGQTYTAFPIELSSFETPGQGTLARPKLRVSNINGYISQFLLTQGDLVGSRFTIKRVYARFIDSANFAGGVNPFGTPNPAAAYEDEIFFVNRKVTENPQYVEFELATPFELDNVQLPRRVATATVCMARPYRDPETCGYSGPPLMDRFGQLFGPGGYGFNTLANQGFYSTGVTYQTGDYVSIISQNDFSYGDTFVYVCSVPNTQGSFNNPQFNSANWIADACPHNPSGCKSHFPTGPLPIISFPGISRSNFVN